MSHERMSANRLLTIGCLADMIRGHMLEKPLVQILGSKRISNQSERVKLSISDELHQYSSTILAKNLNGLYEAGQLADFAVIQIDRYNITSILNRNILLILDLTVIIPGAAIGKKIGNPQPLRDLDAAGSSSSFALPSSSKSVENVRCYDLEKDIEKFISEDATPNKEIVIGTDSGSRGTADKVDMSSEIMRSTRDEEEFPKFWFKAIFIERLYSNQRAKTNYKATLLGNTPEEILRSIWERAKKVVKGKVIFDGKIPLWSEKHNPEFEDIADFILLLPSQKKKSIRTSLVTPRLLKSWNNKSIKIIIHVYSTNVKTSVQYRLVLRKLINPQKSNLSGANSTLASELQKSHPHLIGHDSSWLRWAKLINSSPANDRHQLMQALSPPQNLLKYFQRAGALEAPQQQFAHPSMKAAEMSREIASLKNDLHGALKILQGMEKKINSL